MARSVAAASRRDRTVSCHRAREPMSLDHESADADPRPLLDARGAGALLNVPPSWVLAEARANRIPHVRLGATFGSTATSYKRGGAPGAADRGGRSAPRPSRHE